MSAPSQTTAPLPSPASPPTTGTKLIVIRFIDAHHAEGAIDTQTHAMLHRMVLLISAIGRDLHSIIQSKLAHVSVIHRMGQYAGFVLEGCAVLKRHYTARATRAEAIEEQLDGLAKVLRGTPEEKKRIMQPDALLRMLHVPTGNDSRLFRHLANHFYDTVYSDFLQLHRIRPECPVWSLNGKMLAIQNAIETIHEISQAADELTQDIENEYGRLGKSSKASPATRASPTSRSSPTTRSSPTVRSSSTTAPLQTNSSSPPKARKPGLTVDIKKTKLPEFLPIMSSLSGPPVLPPLPFQIPEVDEPVQQSAPAVVRINKHPVSAFKSFSAVDDQVNQRNHARSATVSSTEYVADQSATGLGISNIEPRQIPHTAGGLSQRKPSATNVPRVFKGSLRELEADVERLGLDKVETPETQHNSPKQRSQPPLRLAQPEDYYRSRSAGVSSTFPSTGTVLQRREAFMSKDTQWESLLVDDEVVRSRRPSDRLQISRAPLVSAQSAEIEEYESDQSTPRVSPLKPGSSAPAPKRGGLRQRENTM